MDTHAEMMLAAAGSDLDFGLGIYSPNYSKRDDTIIRLLFEMEPKIFFEKWKLFTKKKIHNSLVLAPSWEFIIILFLNSQQNCSCYLTCCCLVLSLKIKINNKWLILWFFLIFGTGSQVIKYSFRSNFLKHTFRF